MPWTIPNLVLHDKPVRLANMRSLGRKHVFVNCGNPDCYHNTELDVSRFPDDVTYNDPATNALHSVRSSWRRRWPVMVTSWLTWSRHRIGRQSGIAFVRPLRLTPANYRMGNAPR
jgi:hypothetical protein